ncbi:hypothetical protein [Streptomyces sp. MMBL 11-3]|uniref:hypothetical protein n=1 Tax=Streptomyces sp. MMBL 11-3 TaxID=3382639 RepID=UPI0039B3A5C7
MTHIDGILARALLAQGRRPAPHDIVPPSRRAAAKTTGPCAPNSNTPAIPETTEAAEDLRALCETLVSHTPAAAVADFVTEQVPEPRSALALACVLQLTDTDDGARFWWQYAAGAGQAAAAYCLYLHHRAQGENDTANWWHEQTDDVQPPPALAPDTGAAETDEWAPALHCVTSTSTSTLLRILRHLAKHTVRPRTTAVSHLMAYIPTAVTAGYLREPDMELPLPGDDFAQHIRDLLAAAAARPDAPATLPARPSCQDQELHDTLHETASR